MAALVPVSRLRRLRCRRCWLWLIWVLQCNDGAFVLQLRCISPCKLLPNMTQAASPLSSPHTSLPSLPPGETEEQYLATEALVREVGFDRVNTAAYSPRPNTPAAEWENQVADLIKQDRLNRWGGVREKGEVGGEGEKEGRRSRGRGPQGVAQRMEGRRTGM